MRWKDEVLIDERTIAVENRSYRIAYWVLSYGLLLSTAYRSFFMEQQSWDLLLLVIVGGVVTSIFRGTQRALPRRWTLVTAAAVLLALVIAAVVLRTSMVE